jgi:hypothetical protein
MISVAQTYDVTNQLACLEAVWVSKAAAKQRKGRAGRSVYTSPAVQLMLLLTVVLRILSPVAFLNISTQEQGSENAYLVLLTHTTYVGKIGVR